MVHRPRACVATGAALVAVAVVLSSCGSAPASSGPSTTTASSSTTVTTVAATTTTTAPAPTTTVVPPEAQPTPDQAGQALVAAWEHGDRTAAAAVATPRAVRQLFAGTYGGEVVQDRGCGTPGPNPVVCTFGPYGGAAPTEAIYELTVTPAHGDWYVTGVRVLG